MRATVEREFAFGVARQLFERAVRRSPQWWAGAADQARAQRHGRELPELGATSQAISGKVTGTEVATVVAGRTDAGVHARRQASGDQAIARRHQPGVARQADPDPIPRRHALRPQVMRHSVGARVQFRITPALAAVAHRRRVRRAINSGCAPGAGKGGRFA